MPPILHRCRRVCMAWNIHIVAIVLKLQYHMQRIKNTCCSYYTHLIAHPYSDGLCSLWLWLSFFWHGGEIIAFDRIEKAEWKLAECFVVGAGKYASCSTGSRITVVGVSATPCEDRWATRKKVKSEELELVPKTKQIEKGRTWWPMLLCPAHQVIKTQLTRI